MYLFLSVLELNSAAHCSTQLVNTSEQVNSLKTILHCMEKNVTLTNPNTTNVPLVCSWCSTLKGTSYLPIKGCIMQMQELNLKILHVKRSIYIMRFISEVHHHPAKYKLMPWGTSLMHLNIKHPLRE